MDDLKIIEDCTMFSLPEVKEADTLLHKDIKGEWFPTMYVDDVPFARVRLTILVKVSSLD